MNKGLNILIVDDHPMTVDSYINLLSYNSLGKIDPNFTKSYNCEDAYNKIHLFLKQNIKLDLALLDISLPPYTNFKINNGADLASMIRKKSMDCKIILLTMHSEPFTVDRIIKEINPEGFISKNDINFELFPVICKKIIQGEIYHSPSILQSQKDLFKINFNWDNLDNQILTLLSQGIKTVNLPKHIPLSMSAIEKRKARIKDQILLSKGSDEELISKIKKYGIL